MEGRAPTNQCVGTQKLKGLSIHESVGRPNHRAGDFDVMNECGLIIGALLILGVALGLTNYLADADVTARVLFITYVPWLSTALPEWLGRAR